VFSQSPNKKAVKDATRETHILLKKVVFLDRDGVINYDSPNYIRTRSEFNFIPGSLAAIRELTLNGFTSIVITNQSALARNFISLQELDDIHAMMKKAVTSEGGEIKDIFVCPHMPGDGCDCRKPQPGLIYRAQRKYGIDLTRTVMVGDSARDIECACSAGCGKSVLVKSGTDRDVESILRSKQIVPNYIAQNLYMATQWITANFAHPSTTRRA
jgi:D-glycero-D-manno-heptose 1,7-bisphosphate phosphatase